MATLTTIFVILHVLCWAAAFGMWIAAARTKNPNKGMAHASAAAPVFGLLATIVALSAGWSINHTVVGVKFLIAVLVAVAAFIAIKKRENTNDVLWYLIPVGIVVNIAMAFFA